MALISWVLIPFGLIFFILFIVILILIRKILKSRKKRLKLEQKFRPHENGVSL